MFVVVKSLLQDMLLTMSPTNHPYTTDFYGETFFFVTNEIQIRFAHNEIRKSLGEVTKNRQDNSLRDFFDRVHSQ